MPPFRPNIRCLFAVKPFTWSNHHLICILIKPCCPPTKRTICNNVMFPHPSHVTSFWDPVKGMKHYLITVTLFYLEQSVQSVSLVAQSCPTLCKPMDCSMPVLSVHHQLLEFTQTHVHWVSDAIQPSHPLLSPSLPAFNLSQLERTCYLSPISWSHIVQKSLSLTTS